MPEISVVIPTYNRLDLLKQAVSSCLDANGDADLEVVVVDDGSTDGTREWLLQLRDPRVRHFLQDHQGAPAARNLGVQEALSPLIKLLDDDDVLLEGALARQAGQITRVGPRDIPYGPWMLLDENGTHLGIAPHTPVQPHENEAVHVIFENVNTSAPLHRRADLLEVGGFDLKLTRGQEAELHYRMVVHGFHFLFVPGPPVYGYRIHTAANRISTDPLGRDPLCMLRFWDKVVEEASGVAGIAGHEVRAAVHPVAARQYYESGRKVLLRGEPGAAGAYLQHAWRVAPPPFRVVLAAYWCAVRVGSPRQVESVIRWYRELRDAISRARPRK